MSFPLYTSLFSLATIPLQERLYIFCSGDLVGVYDPATERVKIRYRVAGDGSLCRMHSHGNGFPLAHVIQHLNISGVMTEEQFAEQYCSELL